MCEVFACDGVLSGSGHAIRAPYVDKVRDCGVMGASGMGIA